MPCPKLKLITNVARGLCMWLILYSTLIWWRFILVIGDLRSKLPFLKLPIINAHAHSNARAHQIAKLKTVNYNFMG